MNRKRRRRGPARKATNKTNTKADPQGSWWRELRRGRKWLAATVVPLVLAVAIPGIAPWVVDRTRDLVGEEPLTARSEAYPGLIAGDYWATGDVLTGSFEDVSGRLREHGVQMGMSGHKITLDSNRSGQIHIERITAVIEQRRPALDGTAFIMDPQGTGDVALIEFRLDAGTGEEVPALVARDFNEPAESVPYLADGKVLYVEQGQPQHLVVRASATKCYCRWRVHIEYTYRGDRSELVVPPSHDEPFATTAWTRHKIQYNMHGADGRTPQRHDCVREPAGCRVDG